jgi:hypothetical protein
MQGGRIRRGGGELRARGSQGAERVRLEGLDSGQEGHQG